MIGWFLDGLVVYCGLRFRISPTSMALLHLREMRLVWGMSSWRISQPSTYRHDEFVGQRWHAEDLYHFRDLRYECQEKVISQLGLINDNQNISHKHIV